MGEDLDIGGLREQAKKRLDDREISPKRIERSSANIRHIEELKNRPRRAEHTERRVEESKGSTWRRLKSQIFRTVRPGSSWLCYT